MERRHGKFYIGDDIFWGDREKLKEWMADIFILRAEYRADFRAMEYIGESDHFDPVPEAYSAPEYELQVTKIMDDALHGTFRHEVKWVKK